MSKNILIVSSGIFHPPLRGRLTLQRLLGRMAGFNITQVRSLENLPQNLGKYAALVLNYHHKTISASALARLDDYVRRGGGVLGLHAVTASFKETLPYFEILGGRFTGHGPVEDFEAVNQGSPIFSGLPNFVVHDELYIHDLSEQILVHYTARQAGQEIPVVWTYQYGQGRVCYAVPGHTSSSLSNPVYQAVLQRGLGWVCRLDTALGENT